MPEDKPKPVSTALMNAWNRYQSFLKQQGLAGNPKMNNIAFSKNAMAQYLKSNPDAGISYDDVLPIQQAIHGYRDYVINLFKTDPKHHLAPEGTLSDYSNFMPAALGTGDDGIAGEFTSRFVFPSEYLKTFDQNNNTTTVQNLGYANQNK